MTQPLALDSAAVGEAAGWRRHEDLIDALPYVDTMSPEEKQKVDRMIQGEVCAPLSVAPAAYAYFEHALPSLSALMLTAMQAAVRAWLCMLQELSFRCERFRDNFTVEAVEQVGW